VKHPLRKKLDEAEAQIKDLREEAGTKFTAMQATQKAVAESTETLDAEHELVKAMDEAGRAYGEIGDRLTKAEQLKSSIVGAMVSAGEVPPSGEGKSDDPEREAWERKNGGKRMTAGQRVTDGEDYKALVASGALNSRAALGVKRLGEGWTRDEFKALITGADPTSAGAFMQPDRIGYFALPLRPLTVLDLITVGQTDSDLVEYVMQTGFTNRAGVVAEAVDVDPDSDVGRKPQSAMDFDIVQTPVTQLAHWVAATRRALADVGQMQTIIDGMLRYGLDRATEDEVLAGDGSGEHLRGILETTGLNTIPAGPRSIADKVHMGITQNLLDGFMSTGIVLNPLDWETVRLSREDESTDPPSGAYLFGSPSAQGVETLWGRPVAQSPAMPQGTALVGDLRAAILWIREGTQILASDSHADFFTKNLVAVLAESRAAFGIPYPQALCEVDLAAA
jgi:HK97 family phage major capsid protein